MRGRERAGRTALVVCHGFSRRRTGYMVRVERMVTTMERSGIEPHVLWFVPPKQFLSDGRLGCPGIQVPNVSWVPSIPSFRSGRFRIVMERLQGSMVARVARRLRSRFVQAENPDAMRLCTRLSTPVVFDLHGDTVAEANPMVVEEAELETTGLAVSEGQLLGRATQLICNSRNLETVLSRRHGALPPSIVAPCAADLAPFFEAEHRRDEERRRRGIAERLVLCYLGGLSQWQCITPTIELVSRLKQTIPEVFFLLLTPDDASPYQEQLQRIGRAGVDYSVESLGAAQVPLALSAIDVGILLRARSPTNHVASPTKLAEYLASGAPVVSTRHAGDAAAIIEESGAGRVLAREGATEEEVSGLLEWLQAVKAQRQVWREAATQAARKYCDWSVYERELASVYRRLV